MIDAANGEGARASSDRSAKTTDTRTGATTKAAKMIKAQARALQAQPWQHNTAHEHANLPPLRHLLCVQTRQQKQSVTAVN
jgi:hypothetical protein